MSLDSIVPLDQALDVRSFGSKAAHLARLSRAGLVTAPGLVLGVDLLDAHLEGLGLDAGACAAEELRRRVLAEGLDAALLARLTTELGPDLADGGRYAVRSSAPGEDGRDASFAGQFDSVLDCDSIAAVSRGIRQVWASRWGRRALAYARQRRPRPRGMAVIIQRQVAATVSGVLFSRSPAAPDRDEMLVEYCAGLGEGLVSGRIEPGRLRLLSADGAVAVEQRPETAAAADPARPAIAQALWAAGRRLEALFGRPQDVEWSLDSEQSLIILQSRPITATGAVAAKLAWTNANIAENYPEPICPLLRSFVAAGYAAYFRGLGRAFGISPRRLAAMAEPLEQLVDCHGGRLYYNLSHIHAVLHLAPGGRWLTRFFNQFTGAEAFPQPPEVRQGRLAAGAEAVRVAAQVIWRYLHVQRGLRRFEQRVDAFAAASAPDRLTGRSAPALGDLLQGFLTIRLEQWTDAALADTAAMVSYGLLQTLLDDQAVRANDLLKGLPGLVSAIPVERLWQISRALRREPGLAEGILAPPAEAVLARLDDADFAPLRAALAEYFATWGFRYSGELMLSQPTPQEDPLPVLRLLQRYLAMDGDGPAGISRRQAEARIQATRVLTQRLHGLRRLALPGVLRAAHGAIRLRERARMKQALLYTRLRHVALALGQRLVANGILAAPDDCLFLTMDEAIALANGVAAGDVQTRVSQRRAEWRAYTAWSPPDSFLLPADSYWQPDMSARGTGDLHAGDGLRGAAACGGLACGTAAVLLDVAEIGRIQPGQILVTRQTDPGWAAVFFMIKGLVIERGGMLSHGAIIAREYGIPAVVGVREATRRIANGETICVDGDQGRVSHARD